MFGNLLIKKNDGQTLDSFVCELSKQLNCGNFEERQSSNYIDERYFRCALLGIAVEVSLADEAEFHEYRYRICFQPDQIHVEDKSFFEGLADCVARKLAKSGWEVALPLNFGRVGGATIIYRANPVENAGLREQVITEEVQS